MTLCHSYKKPKNNKPVLSGDHFITFSFSSHFRISTHMSVVYIWLASPWGWSPGWQGKGKRLKQWFSPCVGKFLGLQFFFSDNAPYFPVTILRSTLALSFDEKLMLLPIYYSPTYPIPYTYPVPIPVVGPVVSPARREESVIRSSNLPLPLYRKRMAEKKKLSKKPQGKPIFVAMLSCVCIKRN